MSTRKSTNLYLLEPSLKLVAKVVQNDLQSISCRVVNTYNLPKITSKLSANKCWLTKLVNNLSSIMISSEKST